jgi:heat shock protein HslJ
MRTKRAPVPVLLLALALAPGLTACTTAEDPEPLPLPDADPIAQRVRRAQLDWPWIAGTEWELSAVEGEAPLEGVRVWISFKPDETWVAGSAGCNRFTGGYVRRGENGIQIGPLAATRMFCQQPEGVMQQESRVLHLLGEARSYRASREWFHLLSDDALLLTFRASPPSP